MKTCFNLEMKMIGLGNKMSQKCSKGGSVCQNIGLSIYLFIEIHHMQRMYISIIQVSGIFILAN